MVAFALWRSGLLAELSLDSLKARQGALQGWTAANPWLAAGGFFVVYVLMTAVSLPGATILTLTRTNKTIQRDEGRGIPGPAEIWRSADTVRSYR